jgi:hypothetical protein
VINHRPASGLRSLIKTAAYSVAPRLAESVFAARARAHSHKLVRQWGLFEINERLIQQIGSAVIAGPFAGLEFTATARKEHIGPYLLGTYEMELHHWWREILRGSYSQVVDVGASFGYYAIGLARSFPCATIDAFDTDWWARAALAEMAAANHVSNLSIHDACTPAWLGRHLRAGALLVSDCEGYERELLTSVEIPALGTATMIIELHEALSPGVSTAIAERFSDSHTVEQVASRTSTELPPMPPHSLTKTELIRASAEVRSPQAWMFLRPRHQEER